MVRNIFLLSEVRSGSSYAAELVAYNLAARQDIALWELLREPFQALVPRPTAAGLRRVFDTIWVPPGGVRAAMIKCSQMVAIDSVLHRAPDLAREFFGPETRWLVLRRRDRLAQAASLHCAICSGSYHAYLPVPSCVPCRATDADLLAADDMVAASEDILRHFERRAAHRLNWYYEDIPGNEAQFLDDVFRFVFDREGGFAQGALERVKLTPVHGGEKARMRARLAQVLRPWSDAQAPVAAAAGSARNG